MYALVSINYPTKYVAGYSEEGIFRLTDELEHALKFPSVADILQFVSKWGRRNNTTHESYCGPYNIIKVEKQGWQVRGIVN